MKITAKRVLLLELNEINWRVIDALIERQGPAFLPNFERLKREGAWGVQAAVERPPLLDPWVTWVTLLTGVPPEEHGANVLEQDASTIKAKRLWHYVNEAGRSVGVFGSISAYPPEPVRGFMVPGPFAPGDETYPQRLQPVQVLNRRHTRAHGHVQREPGVAESLRGARALLRLGLRPSTCMRIGAQLCRERVNRHARWRRVGLQPLVNFDFFARLYESERPDFATWHSNHAAHYMHHYWRAWDDSAFSAKASPQERQHYGGAVPHGYRLCDELLGRAMGLIDDRTVLVVASSMGQQPYVSDKYAKGKVVVRVRDMPRLLQALGIEGVQECVPTMVPQWNLVLPDAAQRARARLAFEGVRRRDGTRDEPGFAVSETGAVLTVTPLGLAEPRTGLRYEIGGRDVAMEDLFATDTPTVKQGMHHIDGVIALFGAGVRAGHRLAPCSNLDVAPTVLSLMNIAVPSAMRGQVLREAMA